MDTHEAMREQGQGLATMEDGLRTLLRYAGMEDGFQSWQVAERHSLSRRTAVGTRHSQSLGWLQQWRGAGQHLNTHVLPSGGTRVSQVLPG